MNNGTTAITILPNNSQDNVEHSVSKQAFSKSARHVKNRSSLSGGINRMQSIKLDGKFIF